MISVSKIFPNFDFLGTRESGELLRKLVLNELNVQKEIIVDFSNINSVTQSFGDEFIGILIRSKGLDFVLHKIKLVNASDDIKSTMNFVATYSVNKSELTA